MPPQLQPAPPRTTPRRRPVLTRQLVLFLAAHVVLGVLMRLLPPVATLHAVVCIGAGVLIAATRRARDVAFVVAYISGSEVLWRLTHAAVFHEVAKYAIAGVLLIALARFHARRNRLVAIMYFALLVPSIALTVGTLEPDHARQAISFNLSGPLSLMLCVIFFSSLRLTKDDLRKLYWTFIGPVLGMSTIIAISTAALRELKFTTESNFATSGGFGPNQVSSVFGLALLFTVLMLIERKQPWRHRAILAAISVVFAVQAALTFSRTGLLLALVGVLVAVVYLMRNPRARVGILIGCGLLVAVGNYVVIPQLESFTQGKIGERYTTFDSNGRGHLAAIDIEIFERYPILGVGPGVAPQLRGELGHRGAAHTEFTRMLSEHGILGVLATIMLVILGLRTFWNTRTLEARALVSAFLAWVALFLAIAGMRLVGPCFLAGLACSISFSSIPVRTPKAKPA